MAKDPTTETAIVICTGCSSKVIVPAGPVRAARRLNEPYVTFCSRKCQSVFIAREGLKQQEEVFFARHRHDHAG